MKKSRPKTRERTNFRPRKGPNRGRVTLWSKDLKARGLSFHRQTCCNDTRREYSGDMEWRGYGIAFLGGALNFNIRSLKFGENLNLPRRCMQDPALVFVCSICESSGICQRKAQQELDKTSPTLPFGQAIRHVLKVT